MPYPPQPGLDKRNFFRNEEKLRKYTKMQPHFCQHLLSAPTRGPWIEIPEVVPQVLQETVGPHTGAVD